MSSIIDIRGAYGSMPIPAPSASSPLAHGSDHTETRPAVDTVEFSGAARRLSAILAGSSFRAARIQALRNEIAGGTFETPERLAGTITRLLDVLG